MKRGNETGNIQDNFPDSYMSLQIEKFLHSEGHPERFTELHGEEKREEGGRGAQGELRLNQKRREQASQ